MAPVAPVRRIFVMAFEGIRADRSAQMGSTVTGHNWPHYGLTIQSYIASVGRFKTCKNFQQR